MFSGGEPVYGAVNDNWPTVEPYFNETGSNGGRAMTNGVVTTCVVRLMRRRLFGENVAGGWL